MPEPTPTFFPVRHYSPASARFLDELLATRAFDAVLVEGPSDFNDRLDELFYDHELPLAIYSYAVLDDGRRRGAFYPFCDYSPEWRALQSARNRDTPVRFIDAPWHTLALRARRRHRYSDANFRDNDYVARLCEKLGVQSFDQLWDVLFEVSDLDGWEDYLERARTLCDNMRAECNSERPENDLRERVMTDQIRRAHRDFGPELLVVVGGYHCAGLEALMTTPSGAPEPDEDSHDSDDAPEIVRHGLALTPFTYPRIDGLSGYRAGLQGPAFYEELWEARTQGRPFDASPMLSRIIDELRRRDQLVSTADVVAVETTAQALARLRGRREVWRYDVLDAISTVLVKEAQEVEYGHPYVQIARQIFTGDRRGRLAPKAGVPPLVSDVRSTLDDWELMPRDEPRELTLEFEAQENLEKSRILHRCNFLELAGITWQAGADLFKRADTTRIWEKWHLHWTPEFDATLIEASAYGTTLEEAATFRILEWKEHTDSHAGAAGTMLVEAFLMGLPTLPERFVADITATIQRDGSFLNVADCLGHLLFLHHYDHIFRAQDVQAIDDVMEQAFRRALWLFEHLGDIDDEAMQLLEAVDTLYQATKHGDEVICARRKKALCRMASRRAGDSTLAPLLRGTTSGLCLQLGAFGRAGLDSPWHTFSNPVDVGDFLVGLFRMAREAFVRDRPFLVDFDAFLVELDDEEFLEALPALRMAFTFFTPREKYEICDLLFSAHEAIDIDEEDRRRAADFEARLLKTADAYGIEFSFAPDATHSKDGVLRPESTEFAPPEPLEPTPTRKRRWRLVLGDDADDPLEALTGADGARDRHLAFLYDREYGREQNIRDRSGGMEGSKFTVPEWINGIHELFPRRTIERLEEDALERYQITEIVTSPDILARMEPNRTLLKAVLRCKPLMNRQVLQAAKQLVRDVIEALMERFAREIKSPFQGARNRRQRSHLQIAKNFDARETIRRNLRYYDPSTGKLVIRKPYFFSRQRTHIDRWQIIILVDQSASMLDSVIHSAVMASIFAGIQTICTHLVAFDTSVVDLTDTCRDPVDTLMSVQLGGGTNIANALRYAHDLVLNPQRTVVVLITDFFEGPAPHHLLSATKELIESDVTLLGLAALDHDAVPNYDRHTARKLADLGAHVGAMTPGELANWLANKVR